LNRAGLLARQRQQKVEDVEPREQVVQHNLRRAAACRLGGRVGLALPVQLRRLFAGQPGQLFHPFVHAILLRCDAAILTQDGVEINTIWPN
jgi:hypothetical protein